MSGYSSRKVISVCWSIISCLMVEFLSLTIIFPSLVWHCWNLFLWARRMFNTCLKRRSRLGVRLSLMYSWGFIWIQAPTRSCFRVLLQSFTMIGRLRWEFGGPILCAILMSDTLMFNFRWSLNAFVMTVEVFVWCFVRQWWTAHNDGVTTLILVDTIYACF